MLDGEVFAIDILDYLRQKGVRLTPAQQQGLSLAEEPLLLLAVPGFRQDDGAGQPGRRPAA